MAGGAAACRSPSPPTRPASSSSSGCSRTAGCRSSSAPSTAAWACGRTARRLWMIDALPALAVRERARPRRAARRLRPALRAAAGLHHRRPRRPRHRGRWRRPAGLRQHPVLLPRHAVARRTASRRCGGRRFISQAGAGGPLPPERPGACSDGAPAYVTAVSETRRRRRLARPARRRRHRRSTCEPARSSARGLSMPHSPRCA